MSSETMIVPFDEFDLFSLVYAPQDEPVEYIVDGDLGVVFVIGVVA